FPPVLERHPRGPEKPRGAGRVNTRSGNVRWLRGLPGLLPHVRKRSRPERCSDRARDGRPIDHHRARQAALRKTLRSARPQADDRGRSFPVCRHAACDPCVRVVLAPLAGIRALWSGGGHRHTVDDGSGGGPREGRSSGSAMGVFGTIWDSGEAAGPILAGFLIASLSYTPAFGLIAAFMAAMALLFLMMVKDPSLPVHAGGRPTA